MTFVVSPYFPFPNISWWAAAISADHVLLDSAENFQKMGFHNRYKIATANGPLLLSIPLQGGREQKVAMNSVNIESGNGWKKQHWRSLFSAYGRAPFFEYYGPGLEQLLENAGTSLIGFNKASIDWLGKELHLPVPLQETTIFNPGYPEAIADFRKKMKEPAGLGVHYTQVFEDRNGFLSNLSALDLLMNEGPASGRWIMEHRHQLFAAEPAV